MATRTKVKSSNVRQHNMAYNPSKETLVASMHFRFGIDEPLFDKRKFRVEKSKFDDTILTVYRKKK